MVALENNATDQLVLAEKAHTYASQVRNMSQVRLGQHMRGRRQQWRQRLAERKAPSFKYALPGMMKILIAYLQFSVFQSRLILTG